MENIHPNKNGVASTLKASTPFEAIEALNHGYRHITALYIQSALQQCGANEGGQSPFGTAQCAVELQLTHDAQERK